MISKESQRNKIMKIVINRDADTRNYVKNGMDLDCYYIPRVEEVKREKVLQCLCCYRLDSHMAHECLKKNGIKICSICAGRGHTWKVCEMGDRPKKHKCLNCDGNHTSIPKRNGNNRNFQNRNNRSRSRNYNRTRKINFQKPNRREKIEQKKIARRKYQERERQKREEQNKIKEEKKKENSAKKEEEMKVMKEG